MRLWKRLFPVSGMVLVMVAGILLAGCGKQQPASIQPTGENILVIAPKYEDDNLNPILGYGKYGGSKFFNGLVKFDENLQYQTLLEYGKFPLMGRPTPFTCVKE